MDAAEKAVSMSFDLSFLVQLTSSFNKFKGFAHTHDGELDQVAMLNNEQDWRYGMRVKLLKQPVHRLLTLYSIFWNNMKDFSFLCSVTVKTWAEKERVERSGF